MKRFNWFFMLLLLFTVSLFVPGCVTKNKAVGLSTTSNGFSAKVTAAVGSGSLPAPEVTLVGNQISYASSPIIKKDDNITSIPVFTMSWHRSFFGSLFGIDDTSFTMAYIGIPGETAKDTMTRINAISKGIVNFKKNIKPPAETQEETNMKNTVTPEQVENCIEAVGLKRVGHNGENCDVRLQRHIAIDTTGLQTDNPDAPKSVVPWLASQTDMLANDWLVV